MKSWKSVWLFVLLVIIALSLAACGGDGDNADDEPLPTVAPTLDTSSTEAEDVQSAPPVGDTENTGSSPPVDSQPFTDEELETLTDFSLLVIGTPARVAGTLSIITDEVSGDQVGVLTDEQGNELILFGFPIDMLDGQLGSEIVMEGVISPAAEGDTRLRLESSGPGLSSGSFSGGDGPEGDDLPPGINDAQNAPDSSLSFDGADGPNEFVTLSLQLSTNLTALQTYDELLLNLSEDLLGLELLEIAGSSTEGWSLQFRNIEQGTILMYLVSPDGTVRQSTLDAPEDISSAQHPIDRSRVVVDSDTATTLLSEANTGPVLSLTLHATETGGIEWQLSGFPGEPVDATTAPQ